MNNQIPNFEKLSTEIKKDALRYAGTEAVKFFKESFQKSGFTDTSFQQWPQRKTPFVGKRMLYGKGVLMQSIRKEVEAQRVIVFSDVEYATAHNEGCVITVTQAMKAHFWKLYCELAGIKRNVGGKSNWKNTANLKRLKSGKLSKNKHNAKAELCKRMALMKVGSKIRIPKRQFIGNSQVLNNHLQKFITEKIEERFGVSINLKNGI